MNPETQYMGNPCKRGHDGLRWKIDRACVECKRERTRESVREWRSKKLCDPEWVERERVRCRAKYLGLTPEQRERMDDTSREWHRRKRGWYDNDEMAIEPAKARAIT